MKQVSYIQTDLTCNPDHYLISFRINQLILIYSKPELRAAVYLLDVGLESKQHIIVMHLMNLINTFGNESFNEVLDLFELSPVKLDFNQDDREAI